MTGPGLSRRAVLRCPQDGRRVTCPSSSLLDGLGWVRRVKARPAYACRFASLDTTAAAKGQQLRGGRERYKNPQASARPCKRICKTGRGETG